MVAELLLFNIDVVAAFGDVVAGGFMGSAVSSLMLTIAVEDDFATRTAQELACVVTEAAVRGGGGNICCHGGGSERRS